MDDVRAVMDAVGSERAALFGSRRAARWHPCSPPPTRSGRRRWSCTEVGPERARAADYPWGLTPRTESGASCGETGANGVGRVSLARGFAPSQGATGGAASNGARYGAARRRAPALRRMLAQMNGEIDVRHVLPAIRVPTLVLHRRGDRVAGRRGPLHRRAHPGRQLRRAAGRSTTSRGSATPTRSSTRSRSS